VGIQFEGDVIIYGFHPTEETIAAIGGVEEFRRLMRVERTPVAAIFHDDTWIFRRAYELSLTRPKLESTDDDRLVVYVIGAPYDAARFAAIYAELRSWYNLRKEWPYLFAPITANDRFDNCATVQRQVGMSVPAFEEHEGFMGKYLLLFASEENRWRTE